MQFRDGGTVYYWLMQGAPIADPKVGVEIFPDFQIGKSNLEGKKINK